LSHEFSGVENVVQQLAHIMPHTATSVFR
jgi:hypothetical protein